MRRDASSVSQTARRVKQKPQTLVARLTTTVYDSRMFEIIKTDTFDAWLRGLRDRQVVARINARLRHASAGNLGDVAPVGDGVSEMRLFYGPGYRLYFIRRGVALVVLLCGGDKTTQARDIARAKALSNDWEG